MMIATSMMSMTAIIDKCGHGAENCLTRSAPFKYQLVQWKNEIQL
jgi:hypothetical protein